MCKAILNNTRRNKLAKKTNLEDISDIVIF